MGDHMSPAVSVIIPVFNRNHTLPRALSSALGQTFTNLEIIVVDDASEEPAAEVVRGFGDARVRLIVHGNNRGANAARNTGMVKARGKYVAFLDSDDEWHPHKIQVQVEAMETAPLSVAGHCTGLTAFTEDGNPSFKKSPRFSGNIYPLLLLRNEIGPLSSVLVRRAILAEIGGFDESLSSSQDWDLYLRIAQGYKFLSVSDSLVLYHMGSDSITRNLIAKAHGRKMLLEKHESQMARFPEAFARQLVKTGHYHCRAGALSEGRRLFQRAMRIHPFAISPYFLFFLSLFGGRVYAGAVNFRHAARPFS